MRAAGKPVYCVWSGQRLRDDHDIDHSFPFAAWPCCDAWNLVPASKPIYNQIIESYRTQGALERAGNIIVDYLGWRVSFERGRCQPTLLH